MPTRLFGFRGVPDIVRGFRAEYGEILLPLIFIGFFIFAAISIKRQGQTKQVFIVFVLSFVLISSQLGVTFAPFVHAHRYSDAGDTVNERTYIWMVDSEGNEVMLDDRATGPVRVHTLADRFIHEWNQDTQLEVAQKILDDAERYRLDLNSTSQVIRHPPPSIPYRWDQKPLRNAEGFESTLSSIEEYKEFERIRVYTVTRTFEEDGHVVGDRTRECVIEIHPGSGSVVEECDV